MSEPARLVPRTGVVVVNYGDPSVLAEHALADPFGEGVLVVVVDNLSTPQHRDAVRALCGERGHDLLEQPTNAGFGAGADAGLRHAAARGCEVVVLLNPDARLRPGALEALRDACLADRRALLSPVVVRPDGRTWFDGSRIDLRTGRTGRRLAGPDARPWLSGACLAACADAWAAVGGFDEDYFLYWEDVELSLRWASAGGAVRVLPEAVAVHAVGGTQDGGHAGKSLTYYRYNCRNRLLLARGLPRSRRLTWVLGAPDHAREVLSRGGPHRGRAALAPVLAAARGTLEGLVALLRAPRVPDGGLA